VPPKAPTKRPQAFKPNRKTNVGDGTIRVPEQRLGVFQASGGHVLVRGLLEYLLKYAEQVVW